MPTETEMKLWKVPQEYREQLDGPLCDGLEMYVNHHIRTGSFLEACLENNLAEAIGRADFSNRHRLFEIVSLFYNELPMNAWGSKEKVEAWLAGRGEEQG